MLTSENLRQYSYFSGISLNALEELAGKLVPMSFSDGAVIIREGTPPDYFYFLMEGEVTVKKRNRFGQRGIMSVLSSGQAFGEIAMLTCSHRTSTVMARGNISVLRLSKKDFEDSIMKDSVFSNMLLEKARDYSTYNKFKSLQPLALLGPGKTITLISTIIEKTYSPGEKIIEQGEKGDCYYIIKSGSVAVIRTKDSSPVKVAELAAGEGFGEEALIRDQKRSATVQAIEETTVLVVDEKNFNNLLKTEFLDFAFPEEIPLDNLAAYVFIDARIPPEYEEEHIEGAINIPLEIIRQKYAELDYNVEYLTYCTNDSRGMAAAFLLRSQGFRAKNLRGGLSGWEGSVRSGSDGIHLPVIR